MTRDVLSEHRYIRDVASELTRYGVAAMLLENVPEDFKLSDPIIKRTRTRMHEAAKKVGVRISTSVEKHGVHWYVMGRVIGR